MSLFQNAKNKQGIKLNGKKSRKIGFSVGGSGGDTDDAII